jgi:hypothetical protein
MKVGDYVAKVSNPWLEDKKGPHNSAPIGIIVSKGAIKWSWEVLAPNGEIMLHRETSLQVIK